MQNEGEGPTNDRFMKAVHTTFNRSVEAFLLADGEAVEQREASQDDAI